MGVDSLLEHHLVEIVSIVFFLLAAMTIVEVIEAFDGFHLITRTLGFEDKLLFSGMIVVATNAGGAFSPIGDVTTTMLWIDGQLTFPAVVQVLFFPSLVAFLVPMLLVLRSVKGSVPAIATETASPPKGRNLVFAVGVGFLVSVPLLKTFFHIPPYLSLLTGLGILWIMTEVLGRGERSYSEQRLTLPSALKKIDLPSILFFIGILLAVAALGDAGVLDQLSRLLVEAFGWPQLIASALGVLSAVFDNVPLVAGAARMFPLDQFPSDSPFGWYARRIGLPALAGYVAGLVVLLAQSLLGGR